MLSKVLIGWGLTIFGLLYLAVAIAATADSYTRAGLGAAVIAVVLLSALPSLIIGVVLDR